MEAAAGGAGVGVVGAGDGLEDVAAIFGGAGDGADLIHGPGERHGAGAADQAIGGAQAGDAAEGARHGDGTPGFRAQREGHEAGGDGGGGTGAGASGPARGIPGVEAGAGERGRGEAVSTSAGESTMLSLAQSSAPEPESLWITAASSSKTWSRKGAAPQVVGKPAALSRSLAP